MPLLLFELGIIMVFDTNTMPFSKRPPPPPKINSEADDYILDYGKEQLLTYM